MNLAAYRPSIWLHKTRPLFSIWSGQFLVPVFWNDLWLFMMVWLVSVSLHRSFAFQPFMNGILHLFLYTGSGVISIRFSRFRLPLTDFLLIFQFYVWLLIVPAIIPDFSVPACLSSALTIHRFSVSVWTVYSFTERLASDEVCLFVFVWFSDFFDKLHCSPEPTWSMALAQSVVLKLRVFLFSFQISFDLWIFLFLSNDCIHSVPIFRYVGWIHSFSARLMNQRLAFMVSGFRSDPSSIHVFRFDLISHFFACECLCLNLMIVSFHFCFQFWTSISDSSDLCNHYRMFSLLYPRTQVLFETFVIGNVLFWLLVKACGSFVSLPAFSIFDFFTPNLVELQFAFPVSWTPSWHRSCFLLDRSGNHFSVLDLHLVFWFLGIKACLDSLVTGCLGASSRRSFRMILTSLLTPDLISCSPLSLWRLSVFLLCL